MKIKKILAFLFCAIIAASACFTAPVTASAVTVADYDRSQLTNVTFTGSQHKVTVNVTAPSVLTLYATPSRETTTYGSTYYWSTKFTVTDSYGNTIGDNSVSSSQNYVEKFEYIVNKGAYTITFSGDNGSTFGYKAVVTPTSQYGDKTAQNGKLLNFKYLQKSNRSVLNLTTAAKVTVFSTVAAQADGYTIGSSLYIRDNNNKQLALEYLTSGSGDQSRTYWLPAGKYIVELEINSGYDWDENPYYNQYKISWSAIGKNTVVTPNLKYTKKASTYYDELSFSWVDNANYDGVELYEKTNNSAWTLVRTVTNSSYWRTYGFTSTYYKGNAKYYKVRAYKEGLNNSKFYSQYSNVVSFKDLGKISAKVSLSGTTVKAKVASAVTNATGYEIWRSTKKSSGYKKVATTTSLSWSKSIKKDKKAYYYKVRAYRNVGGDKMYSSFSSPKKIEPIATPSSLKLTAAKKKATVSFKKVSGAKGYEIYRSTKKSSGFKKVKSTTSLKFTNKSLKSKKTYYYKVRAYKMVGSTKVYSKFSSVKSVKVK